MLSRPLYEMLPYLYLGSAAVTLNVMPLGLSHLFALLLFAGGALVWIIRSNARRRDRRRPTPRAAHVGRPLHISFASYEFYPFVVMAGALWLTALGESVIVVVLGVLLTLYSLWVLQQRAAKRGHGWVQLGGWQSSMFGQ